MNQLIDKILTLCTSTDQHRGVITGRHFKQDQDGLHVVTNDSHRLARYTDPTQASEIETRITRDTSGMPMGGQYPAFERVIPDPKEATHTFELPIETLREVLLSLKPFVKGNANRVTLVFDSGMVTVSAKRSDLQVDYHKDQKHTPTVYGHFRHRALFEEPEQEPKPFAIALNCLYLLDVLPVAKKGVPVPELVRLRCTEATRPVLIDFPDMPDWDRLTCVIMPMQLA
jgi:DNA polymerase III sliding clamp (beta) subunit (PCNA family)